MNSVDPWPLSGDNELKQVDSSKSLETSYYLLLPPISACNPLPS